MTIVLVVANHAHTGWYNRAPLNRDVSICCLSSVADDLFKVHKLKPNLKWRQALESYLKTMPPYYLMVRNLTRLALLSLNTALALIMEPPSSPPLVHLVLLPHPPQPLKKALRMMGVPHLMADNMDCGLSYSVISYLKKLSQQVMESSSLGSQGLSDSKAVPAQIMCTNQCENRLCKIRATYVDS